MQFTVPGEPRPKQRARIVLGRHGYHGYTPRATRVHERTIQQYAALQWRSHDLLAGPITVLAEFWCADRSHRADVDNLLKAVTDALQGVVYQNDRQIALAVASRLDCAPNDAKTVVLVRPLAGRPSWAVLTRIGYP